MRTPAAIDTTDFVGCDQGRDLAQYTLDVDRLHSQYDDVGGGHQLGVVGHVLHAVALGQRSGPARSAVGDHDAPGEARVGVDPAGDHRGGHIAGSDQPDCGSFTAHTERIVPSQ